MSRCCDVDILEIGFNKITSETLIFGFADGHAFAINIKFRVKDANVNMTSIKDVVHLLSSDQWHKVMTLL